MNKRIDELIEQCTAQNFSDCVGGYETFDKEKFAELIVQECMEQVKEQYLPVSEDAAMMNDEHWKGYKHCGVDSVVAIREHFFGVEEQTPSQRMAAAGYTRRPKGWTKEDEE